MNQTSTIIKALCLLLFPAALWGQSAGDFRSFATGNWNNTATWERYDGSSWITPAPSTPTSADGAITIRNGHIVTINASVTADQITVDAGGTLNNNTGGATLTLNNETGVDLTVNGTFLLRGLNVLTAAGGTPTVEINGTMNWFSGTSQASLTVNNSGILNIGEAPTNNDKIIQNANITNNGTINWVSGTSNGNIDMRGCLFVNNGTINEIFGKNTGFFNTSGTNSITNNGLLNKTTTFALAINTVPFTNSSSGVIKGIGTISSSTGNFSINNSGKIYPGNSPGQLTLSNNFVSTESPSFWLEIIDGTGAGTGHDKIDFNTALTNVDVSGTTLVVQENTSAPIQSYTILENTGGGVITGNFATVTIPLGYSITYNPGVSTSVVVTKLGTTLPAVWGSFTAIARNNQVVLNWETLQETNVTHFTIEYSANGRDYLPLGTVNAAGNSNSLSKYSFTHNLPDLQKSNYYRIRQSDVDGKSAISAVRLVKFGKAGLVPVTALPNPVRDRLQLQVQADDIRVILTDLAGRSIKSMQLQPGYHEINMSRMAPGMYQLVIYKEGRILETQKIVKQ